MPATEQTWRSQRLMHTIFAISGVVLLAATLWMFADDHLREWKPIQRQANTVEVKMDSWRRQQFDTEEFLQEQKELREAWEAARIEPIEADLLAAFTGEVQSSAEERGEAPPRLDTLTQLNQELGTLGEEAQAAREKVAQARGEASAVAQQASETLTAAREKRQTILAADDRRAARAEAEALEDEAAEVREQAEEMRENVRALQEEAEAAKEAAIAKRQELLGAVNDIVAEAKYRERNLLGIRKFTSADLDEAKANLSLAIRDQRGEAALEEIRGRISQIEERLAEDTLAYQAAVEQVGDLQQIVERMTAEESAAKKAYDDNLAAEHRLAAALEEKRSNWIDWSEAESLGVSLPWFGKKWLELPVLDAFNSPLQVKNQWSEGLTIDYNFDRVRRFDRCATCHALIDKSLPGEADKPAFDHQRLVELVIQSPAADQLPQPESDNGDAEDADLNLLDVYGFRLAPEGLLADEDVTVSFVAPLTAAAKAQPPLEAEATEPQEGLEIRRALLKPGGELDQSSGEASGLMIGDRLVKVGPDPVYSVAEAERLLLDYAGSGLPVPITIERGLPHPYASHPRLDLFVGSLSPHKVSDFACTICHEGQGSATSFQWASHTPNSSADRRRWSREHDWHDNPHWIYPMYPERFIESTCLKCHHDVVDLKPSEQFPEPPAPKVVHGYELISKYGCYGCHEINGYDGDRRIGPDLRLEPNYFAAAQQLQADADYDQLSGALQEMVQTLVEQPENDGARHQLRTWLTQDAAAEDPVLSDRSHEMAPLLNDMENPGDQRKAGPSLRFAAQKLDRQFLYDWLRDPAHFRPDTRMPRFFGLWNHLKAEPESLELSEQYEPIEILGVLTYLLESSQQFEYLEPPEGIRESSREEKIARGKELFETRGCLACHSHDAFPEMEEFRPEDEIVQGPDLSGVADKFDPERNPQGPRWLYSWIKEPSRYHARTKMPDLQLEPITDSEGETTDPVEDIVQFLLAESEVEWEPRVDQDVQLAGDSANPLTAEGREHLNSLALLHLKDAFFERTAERYLETGIPAEMADEVRGAEKLLLPSEGDQADGSAALSQKQKLLYIGSKTITKYGCYGCHDIPGFEEAKPIGTGLADWGRKDPSKLAFEHIAHYLHSHGHEGEETPGFYEEHIAAGHREGFIYQKLAEPRSYDYHKTEEKKYNERLRMPEFPFEQGDREAIITFVLGLVADPPVDKFVHQPDEREKAILAGRKVLDKYNCAGCHMLDVNRWSVAYDQSDIFELDLLAKTDPNVFPFLKETYTPEQMEASAETDRRGKIHAELAGLPTLGDNDGLPVAADDEFFEIENDLEIEPSRVRANFQLWEPALVGGKAADPGLSMYVPLKTIEKARSAPGGHLARYLLPRVVAREKERNPQAKGSEAWGWLPPALVGEGEKVQADWLHGFLLDPHPIRPLAVLRMPDFNMSPDEATALVNYFAAVDNANYPYQFDPRQSESRLAAEDARYRALLEELAAAGNLQDSGSGSNNDDANNDAGGESEGGGENEEAQDEADALAGDNPLRSGSSDPSAEQASPGAVAGGESRFDAAMNIVTFKDYCVSCHQVGDYAPDAVQSPDLAITHKRLRAGYVRDWIANPKRFLPYTGMPAVIPYDPNQENLGGVPQKYYHGASPEQLDAVVDLLMNYDDYAKQKTSIKSLVEQAAPAEEETATGE